MTQPKQHTATKRPQNQTARKKGEEARLRKTLRLRQVAFSVLGYSPVQGVLNDWSAQRRKATTRSNTASWASMRIRPEVVATVTLLQERHLTNTGKEISQSEVVCALIASGLPHLVNSRDFATPSTNH